MAPYDDGPIDPFYPHGPPSTGSARPARGLSARAPVAELRRPRVQASRPAPAIRPGPRPLAPRSQARPASSSGRLVRSFLPLILAVGAGAAYYAYQTFFQSQSLLLLNGLDVAVDVIVMDEGGNEHRAEIRARGRANVSVSGPVLLDAVTRDGRPVETAEFEVPPGTDLVAYNLLGAAAVQLEEIVYSASPTLGFAPTFILLGGERLIVRDDVMYIFVEPPAEVTIPDNTSRVSHWHFGYVGDGSWLVTVNALLGPGGANPENRARAQTIVDAMRRLDPTNVAAQSFENLLRGPGAVGPGLVRPPAPPLRQPGPGQVIGPGGIGNLPPPGRIK